MVRFARSILVATALLAIGFAMTVHAQEAVPAARSSQQLTTQDEPVPTPESFAFRCWPEVQHTVNPSMMLLGEAPGITATMVIRPNCWGGGYPLHFVVVLTGSRDASDASKKMLLERLTGLVDQLSIDESESTRMGIVVASGDRARTVLPITGDQRAVLKAFSDWHLVRVGTRTGISKAFHQTRAALDAARAALPPSDHPYPSEFTIVVGELGGQERCDRLVRDAKPLKNDGVPVYTACTSEECLTSCHREVATHDRYAFGEHDWKQFDSVYRSATAGFKNVIARRLDVELTLGPHFEFEESSASPPISSRDGKQLLWSDKNAFVPRSGVTFTYRARAIIESPGDYPLADRTLVSTWSSAAYPRFDAHRLIPSPRILDLQPRTWPIRSIGEDPTEAGP